MALARISPRLRMGETKGVKFGLSYNTGLAGTDPANLKAIARHADDLGFESFYVPEHVTLCPGARVGEVEFARSADRRPCGVPGLRRRVDDDGPARHGRAAALPPPGGAGQAPGDDRRALRPLRRSHAPAHDRVGSLPGEAAAVGVDYATRGRRADEAIDVLRAVWAGDAVGTSVDGEFYSFETVTSFPKPLQMLPIHVGGSSAAAARRAGRRGDGFFPGGRLTPAERLAQIELMHTTTVAEGRDPEVSSTPAGVRSAWSAAVPRPTPPGASTASWSARPRPT